MIKYDGIAVSCQKARSEASILRARSEKAAVRKLPAAPGCEINHLIPDSQFGGTQFASHEKTVRQLNELRGRRLTDSISSKAVYDVPLRWQLFPFQRQRQFFVLWQVRIDKEIAPRHLEIGMVECITLKYDDESILPSQSLVTR